MRAVWLAACVALAGCKVGPDYRTPAAPIPIVYKELAGWQIAQPQDTADRGAWWSIYNDPVLDGLERQIDVSNQTLKAAEAAYRTAQATVGIARANLFPVIGANAGVTRSFRGGNSSSSGSGITSTGLSSTGVGSTGVGSTGLTTTTAGTTTGVITNNGTSASTTTTSGTTTGGTTTGISSSSGRTTNIYSLEGSLSWEIDVWGRIRRQIESDVATAQASAADVAAARLSAQGQLATYYFELRSQDSLQQLLDRTVSDYQRSLQITENQYNVGVAARGDVVAAQALLESTQATAVAVAELRAQYEHAIAVLTGHPPADLTIPPGSLTMDAPAVPPGLPSTLLQRRPDVAAAERSMQAENALVGVEIAAYYPQVNLSALAGFSGNPLGSLISAANRIWSLGAAASETIFDAGARTASVAAARATYDQSVANYRQTVLTAFQQVEDELVALRVLGQQAVVQDRAVQSVQRATAIALNQYRAGTVPYTTVITEQAMALADEQTALTIRQSRLVASVALVQALGGGWDAGQLPSSGKIERSNPLFP